jgi:hypothetical protein
MYDAEAYNRLAGSDTHADRKSKTMPSQHSNESSITPQGESTFEYVARRLHLSPEKYASSAKLKAWVRRNKDHKYVPSYLLVAWHFDVDIKLFGGLKKPPKRAA